MVIHEHSDPANPTDPEGEWLQVKRNSTDAAWSWKRALSPQEISRIRDAVGSSADLFYTPEEWLPDPSRARTGR